MYALITGASSGIGMEMAKILSADYDLILVARHMEPLQELQTYLQQTTEHTISIIGADVSAMEECQHLRDEVADKPIEILINGAGFGVYGSFTDTSLERELEMIDTNVAGTQTLMKLFLPGMIERGHGYILNIASSAGYMPGGPKMAGYYASKAYVLSLTRSVAEELRMNQMPVYVGALCPGPVKTKFNIRAGVKNDIHGISASVCAAYGLKQMFHKKELIIPGWSIKWTYIGSKLMPDRWLLYFAGKIQNKKG